MCQGYSIVYHSICTVRRRLASTHTDTSLTRQIVWNFVVLQPMETFIHQHQWHIPQVTAIHSCKPITIGSMLYNSDQERMFSSFSHDLIRWLRKRRENCDANPLLLLPTWKGENRTPTKPIRYPLAILPHHIRIPFSSRIPSVASIHKQLFLPNPFNTRHAIHKHERVQSKQFAPAPNGNPSPQSLCSSQKGLPPP